MNHTRAQTERPLAKHIEPVRQGMLMATAAMMLGVFWAGYLATQHERLHGGFEKQEAVQHARNWFPHAPAHVSVADRSLIPQAHAHGAEEHEEEVEILAEGGVERQHSHTGNLALDAMQRLLRGHIHWMGLGILSAVMLLIVAFTSLRSGWKRVLGWTFGIGALVYPTAWILMGFRTVLMGPEASEESVRWLFVPAAGLVLASLSAVFVVLLLEIGGLHRKGLFHGLFEAGPENGE